MNWMESKLAEVDQRSAFVDQSDVVSYRDLLKGIDYWKGFLMESNINEHDVVAIIADYSPDSTALIIALLTMNIVIVPLTPETRPKHERFFQLAGVKHVLEHDIESGNWMTAVIGQISTPPLIKKLVDDKDGGFVLFTSGTSGESKGVVLSAKRLMKRFEKMPTNIDKSLRCLVFLKLDHIGGLNTLFSILFSGGTAVSVNDHSAETVCEAVEKHKIQLLPTTPTFLNMLLLSGAHLQYDLTSLSIITYGTEPMPSSTLHAVHTAFPTIKLKQTYGLTELGIFSTKSKDSSSDWMRVGGDGIETKVENGIFFVRSQSAMLGYLNAPSPFTEDGWYNTGDRVEVDGEYIRILGRDSEIINVGGEKVYPAEVESVLLEMPHVKEVVVKGKPNPVTGNIVIASFVIESDEDRRALYRRMVNFCSQRLESFKIPKVISISNKTFVSDRLKKSRNSVVV